MLLCAPTREQAKRLHWKKTKALIPDKYVRRYNGRTKMISETELTLTVDHNGLQFAVVGLDKPERAEGDAVSHVLMDEVADMKPMAWAQSIRPSLSTEGREGSADFIGKPRGKGFYWQLWTKAKTRPGWARFKWKSSVVLSQSELLAARDELSEKEFEQEYEAEFVSFEGMAYYPFDEDVHAAIPLEYDPDAPLDLCFDFNVEPGTATVVQNQSIGKMGYELPGVFLNEVDCVLDEVWIPENSNTRKVCRQILKRWSHHGKRPVRLFGDWNGGSRKTSATEGTDWEQIKDLLGKVFTNMTLMIKPPTSEVDRINALNARLLSHSDRSAMLIDPQTAPHTIVDFQTVTRLPDGQLDKRDAMKLYTHLTDGLGDRARYLHPTTRQLFVDEPLLI